jgi:phage tail sheath gpL-like
MPANTSIPGTDAASSKALDAVPVLLLKTASTPSDSYEELFNSSTGHDGRQFDPNFLPVMQHKFEDAGMSKLRDLLRRRRINPAGDFGGLIFTSQRAVEAFAQAVAEERNNQSLSPFHLMRLSCPNRRSSANSIPQMIRCGHTSNPSPSTVLALPLPALSRPCPKTLP